MKRISIIILLLLGCYIKSAAQVLTSKGVSKTVITSGPGTLSQKISDEEKYQITDLKISGPINGTDWLFLQEMMGFKFIYLGSGHEEGTFKHEQTEGKLEKLDLWQADIWAGGDFYSMGWGGAPKIFSKDNTITSGMFNFAFTSIDYKLKEVILPNSVKKIEGKAFCFVHNLKSVTIGQEIEDMIGEDIFYGCRNMGNVIFLGDIPPRMSDYYLFSNKSYTPHKIYVPSNASELYEATNSFKNLEVQGTTSIYKLYYLTLNNQFHGELPESSSSSSLAEIDLISYTPNEAVVSNLSKNHYLNNFTYWVKEDDSLILNIKPVYDEYGIEKLIIESTDTGEEHDVSQDIKYIGNGDYSYEFGTVNSNITIKPQLNPVEYFGIEDQERKYGDPNELRYYHHSAGNSSDKQYISEIEGVLICDADIKSPCGVYIIKFNPAYSLGTLARFINNEAKLRIDKADLLIIGPTLEREYGKPNPEITFEYSGFKNGENKDVLTHQPIGSIPTTIESPVGIYPIGMSYASAANYEINYKEGYLNIVKAKQTITWNQDFKDVKVGEKISLTAYSSSGLPINYLVSDNNVADIKEGEIKFLAEGSISIIAFQPGNQNYNAADPIKLSFVVKPNSVEYLSLDYSEIITEPGKNFKLNVSWEPQNAVEPELIWVSDNPDIATVNQIGLVSGVAVGETNVSVSIKSNPDIKASCRVIIGFNSSVGENEYSKINISVLNGFIYIEGNADKEVRIYTTDGRLIYNGNNNKIHLSPGLYIVKVGKEVKKIIL